MTIDFKPHLDDASLADRAIFLATAMVAASDYGADASTIEDAVNEADRANGNLVPDDPSTLPPLAGWS